MHVCACYHLGDPQDGSRMTVKDNQLDEAGSQVITAEETPKVHRALDRITRELSDEELDSPGARKLLLERLVQAEETVSDLEVFREKFHEADKRICVLVGKLKTNVYVEAVSMASLAIGSVILGYAQGLLQYHNDGGWLALACGAVLLIIGVLAKVVVILA